MRTKLLGMLAVGLLAGPTAAYATLVVTISTDTATDLTGTFEVTGYTPDTTYAVTNFGSFFPLGYAYPTFAGMRANPTGTPSAYFGTRAIGEPDSPRVQVSWLATAQTFAAYSGMYDNNADPSPFGVETDVYFLFSDLADSGGDEGAFSGSFCFSARENRCFATVPEPGTLALLGLGLAGLGLGRRRRPA